MRKLLLVCGLALMLGSAVAYTTIAPAQGVSPQDEHRQVLEEIASRYEASMKRCAESAYAWNRELQETRASLLGGNTMQYMRLEYVADQYKDACWNYHWNLRGLVETRAELAKPTPTPTPTTTDPADPQRKPTPKSSPETEKKIVETPGELKDKHTKFLKEQDEKLRELKEKGDKLLKEINEIIRKAKSTKPKQPQPGYKSEFDSTSGLFIVKFTTPEGVLKVSLPDDMRAGDTISGSVTPEPNGQTKEERAKNRAGLNQYQLTIANSRPGADDFILKLFRKKPPTANTGTVTNSGLSEPCACPVGFSLSASGQVVSIEQPANVSGSPEPGICGEGCPAFLAYGNVLDNISGDATTTEAQYLKPLTEAQIDQLYDIKDTAQPPAEPKPNQFRLPTIGQNGSSVEIKGPFDGNLRTTDIRIGGQPVITLAESPRSCIFKSPEQNFGLADITLKENNVETKGTYRNIGVRLNADKTSLLKSESTTMTAEVSGLQGIQRDQPLHLESSGVINMAGGNYQYVSIRPQDVKPDGRYTTTRTITGLQAGGFGVTATVFHRSHFIPLTENAAVNGVRVKKVGNQFLFSIENVKDPLKGDPLEGPYEVDYGCLTSTKLSRVLASFKKGNAEAPMFCVEGRYVYASVTLDF